MITVIYNGKIYGQREQFSQAVMINNGHISECGSSKDLLEKAPVNAETIDADGALVLPAFHDSHLHLLFAGQRARNIQCGGASSIDEVIALGRQAIAQFPFAPKACIQGIGVNPDRFSQGEKRDLNREDIDKISTEYPVILSRHCGHTIYCNSLALKLAGISESAPCIEGGAVEKDSKGRPTGVLRENTNALIRSIIPAPSAEDRKGFLRWAMRKAQSLGIASCGSYDIWGPDFAEVLEAYQRLYDEFREAGRPGLRVTLQLGISNREDILDDYLSRNAAAGGGCFWHDPQWGTFLKMQSVKLFADGTLGGQTAWMRQPYRDKPETAGFPIVDQETLNYFVEKSAKGGMQVLIHAIGDAGVDSTLQAFERVTEPGKNPLRHGVVHCQVTSLGLLERMARNKILALVQPIFLADDMYILENRVGPELAATSYAWGTMQRLGIPVSYGSDAPISSMDPLLNIAWAVLRKDSEDPLSSAFYPHEKVDVYSAVDACTEGSAFSSFDEASLGRIKPGAYADLVFLDRDIFTIPPEDIRQTRVLRTICAGETVYQI